MRSMRSGAAAVELFKRDDVAIGIPYDEPSGAPLRFVRLEEDVLSLGQAAEALVDVVDVQVQARRAHRGGGKGAWRPGLRFYAAPPHGRPAPRPPDLPLAQPG